MEAKFTHGPWRDDQIDGVVGDDGKAIVVWGLSIGHGQKTPEREANAKLMLASPLLYEALNSYDQIIRVVLQALERDAENGKAVRGEMAAELREKLGNACNALRAARGEK